MRKVTMLFLAAAIALPAIAQQYAYPAKGQSNLLVGLPTNP